MTCFKAPVKPYIESVLLHLVTRLLVLYLFWASYTMSIPAYLIIAAILLEGFYRIYLNTKVFFPRACLCFDEYSFTYVSSFLTAEVLWPKVTGMRLYTEDRDRQAAEIMIEEGYGLRLPISCFGLPAKEVYERLDAAYQKSKAKSMMKQ